MVGLNKNKIKLLLFFSVFTLIIGGCKKKTKTYSTKSYVINKSSHRVEILPYYNGTVIQGLVQQIEPYATQVVYTSTTQNEFYPLYYNQMLFILDSVVTLFDGVRSSNHIKYFDTTTYYNAIVYASNRSLMNGNNWGTTITFENEEIFEGFNTFYLFEQDYQNAK